jgi:predicted restriction endonuclease
VRNECKICHNIRGIAIQKRWREKHPELVMERNRAYHEHHKQEDKVRAKAWKQVNQEKVKAQGRIRRQTQRESINANNRAWRKANPGKVSATGRAWYIRNTKRVADRMRKWRHTNPDKVSAHNKRRRAQRKNAPINTLTAQEWLLIQEHYDHRCIYCGKRRKGKLTQEHVQPLSQGGSHHLQNIVPACLSCNSKRGNRTLPIPVQTLLL